MKDPEEVRRIENMASARTALTIIEKAFFEVSRNIGLTIPQHDPPHPLHKRLGELYTAIDKLGVEIDQTMKWLKK